MTIRVRRATWPIFSWQLLQVQPKDLVPINLFIFARYGTASNGIEQRRVRVLCGSFHSIRRWRTKKKKKKLANTSANTNHINIFKFLILNNGKEKIVGKKMFKFHLPISISQNFIMLCAFAYIRYNLSKLQIIRFKGTTRKEDIFRLIAICREQMLSIKLN